MREHELKAIELRARTTYQCIVADIPALVAEVRRLRDANCDLMDKLENATGGEEVFIQVLKP